MTVLIQSALIAVVLSAYVTIVCFTARKMFRSYFALGVMALCFSLFNATFLIEQTNSEPTARALHLFFMIWLAGTFLFFISRFGSKKTIPYIGPIFAAIGFLSMLPFLPELESLLERMLPVYSVLAASGIGFALTTLYRIRPKIEDPVEDAKITLLISGTAVCVLLSIGDLLTRVGYAVPAFGSIVTSVFLVFLYKLVSAATLKDVREIVINGFRATVLSIAVALIFLFVSGWARHDPWLYVLNTFVASLILLFVMAPLQRRLEALFLRRFFHDKQSLIAASELLRSRIPETRDANDLTSVVRAGLNTSLRIENVHLYVFDPDSGEIRPLGHSDAFPAPPLDRTSPIVRFIQRFKVPLNLDQIRFELKKIRYRRPEDQVFFAAVVEEAVALGFVLVLPLISEERIIGGIAIQIPRSGASSYSFSVDEIGMLEQVGNQLSRQIRHFRYFERLNEQARLAILGEMSAALAHEIKNPLAAVKGAADCAKTYTDETRRVKYLNIISDEIDRLDLVVNQFLNVAKQTDLEYTANIREVIERAVTLIESGKAIGHIRIETQIPNGPLIAAIDPVRLQQVLLNILNNSVEAMEGSGDIRIDVARLDQPTPIIRITLSDTGPGMAPETIDKIFVPFFTTKATGSGLGLPISQKIIALFGGRLSVESSLGAGTRFTIELRRAQGELA